MNTTTWVALQLRLRPDFHALLKANAVVRGMPLNTYIGELLQKGVGNEDMREIVREELARMGWAMAKPLD